jgi:hypothetical protein
MINFSEINSQNPLVILRGEYGVTKEENSPIAAPNVKRGSILILFDEINKISAMAHFDGDKNLSENLDKLLQSFVASGAKLENVKYNLITREEND